MFFFVHFRYSDFCPRFSSSGWWKTVIPLPLALVVSLLSKPRSSCKTASVQHWAFRQIGRWTVWMESSSLGIHGKRIAWGLNNKHDKNPTNPVRQASQHPNTLEVTWEPIFAAQADSRKLETLHPGLSRSLNKDFCTPSSDLTAFAYLVLLWYHEKKKYIYIYNSH